jgi:short-subunit dehydrogenase
VTTPSPAPAALVTGGASGLGRAFCRELASTGHHVVIADVSVDRGEALARELGPAATFVRTDVTRPEDLERAVASACDGGRPLAWLVQSAGFGIVGEVRDMEPAHWRRLFDVNVLGVAHGLHAAYPRMVAQSSGRILNVASAAGLVPAPTGAAYGATKSAVVSLSLALRAEARDLGVSVTVACPGFIRTGFGDAAEYLRVERARLFTPAQEDPELQRRLARHALRAAMAGRAVAIWPARLRLAWWAWRLAPWACEALVLPRFVRRHRAART